MRPGDTGSTNIEHRSGTHHDQPGDTTDLGDTIAHRPHDPGGTDHDALNHDANPITHHYPQEAHHAQQGSLPT